MGVRVVWFQLRGPAIRSDRFLHLAVLLESVTEEDLDWRVTGTKSRRHGKETNPVGQSLRRLRPSELEIDPEIMGILSLGLSQNPFAGSRVRERLSEKRQRLQRQAADLWRSG